MSQGLNKTTIIGHLGRDPETNGAQNVARFTVGVTERWRDREGEEKEHTEWYRVVAFNGVAEACAQYLEKERRVYVEGRLRTRTYTNRDEQEKTITELLASMVIFLDGPRADSNGTEPRPKPANSRKGGQPPSAPKSAATQASTEDEGIPF
jgi:single-strand DNA-binding protein